MSDEVPPPPPKHATTTQLPREDILSGLITKLSQTVSEGFDGVDKRLDAIEANQDIQAATVRDLQQRMTRSEERADKSSIPVRMSRVTENDMKQDAALASLNTKMGQVEERLELAAQERAMTAQKVDAVHGAVTGFLANPRVKFVGSVLFAIAVLVYGWLQAKGHQ